MMKTTVFVDLFAYLLTFLFGVLLATVAMAITSPRPLELFLFFLFFSASVGLIFKKEWARTLIRAASFGGIFFFAVNQTFILQKFDVTSLAMMGICVLIIYFYRVPLATLYHGENGKGPQWTVLVVDDDLTFVKLVRSHFTKKGLTVISSESGERGIEMAKRWKPHLVILDVILPGIKGRTVCAKLKEDPDTQDIPVMFVTFKNSLDDISAEMELGAVMHLTKPVDYDHLYEQVRKILVKR